MARTPRPIQYDVTDDLTGEVIEEADAEIVTFGYDGKSYKIETHKDNRAKLEDFLASWIEKAAEDKPEARKTGAKGDGKERPGAGAWKKSTYGQGGRLNKDQIAAWDALPEAERKKWADKK